ncbi:hypothetical protein [Methylogaea oryzae]|uniref:hypothetical protein n=1 Tax=Methylogaea oryzae TaxID=1295382 RepID=UPI0006D1B3FD|nr:hypothetical protein [Methylogaea oryzae]
MLNPIIAYLAFYWLTQSILLQRDELSATKKALEESAKSQEKQEQHASKTAKVNALSTLINAHNNDISNLRSNMEFLSNQLSQSGPIYSPIGHSINIEEARVLQKNMTEALETSLKRRMEAMDEVTKLLHAVEM